MTYLPPAASHVSAAEQAYYRGDRESAYQLIKAALLCDPQWVDAWLWLGRLAEDTRYQRECYERVLALDPANRSAKDGIETLRLRQLLSATQHLAQESAKSIGQLGLYLLKHQTITADQLQEALREQRMMRRHGEFAQLGDILLKKGWITPEQLAQSLIAQLSAKLRQPGHKAPKFLGEYLVAEGIITLAQLEKTLAEQMQLSLIGQRVALGGLLLRNKLIEADQLQRVLEQQRIAFYGRFDD